MTDVDAARSVAWRKFKNSREHLGDGCSCWDAGYEAGFACPECLPCADCERVHLEPRDAAIAEAAGTESAAKLVADSWRDAGELKDATIAQLEAERDALQAELEMAKSMLNQRTLSYRAEFQRLEAELAEAVQKWNNAGALVHAKQLGKTWAMLEAERDAALEREKRRTQRLHELVGEMHLSHGYSADGDEDCGTACCGLLKRLLAETEEK